MNGKHLLGLIVLNFLLIGGYIYAHEVAHGTTCLNYNGNYTIHVPGFSKIPGAIAVTECVGALQSDSRRLANSNVDAFGYPLFFVFGIGLLIFNSMQFNRRCDHN